VGAAAVRGQNNGTNANGYGVYGSHAGDGAGVYGTSNGGWGVLGDGGLSGIGLRGTGYYGAWGHSPSGLGVLGSSDIGTGVYGVTGSTLDNAAAVQGTLTSATPGVDAAAVFGQIRGTTDSGYGVYGLHDGDGVGVYGKGSGLGYGVQGISDGSSGVVGISNGGPAGVAGVCDSGWGMVGVSTSGYGVHGISETGIAVFANGDFAATGTKAALVPAEQGSLRTLYCLESPECWFEDFGTAQLTGGTARVTIEPLFAATVRTDQYHIFLTPHGDSKGLYVSAVDAAGFTVREQQGGSSTLAFNYRVVARRKDVAALRLAQVQPPEQSRLSALVAAQEQRAPRIQGVAARPVSPPLARATPQGTMPESPLQAPDMPPPLPPMVTPDAQ
jgi:hypothetical protein